MLGLGNTISKVAYQWSPKSVSATMKLWLRNGVGISAARWYDQSGNGNNAAQATSGFQGSVVDGGLDLEGSNEDQYPLTSDIVISAKRNITIFLVMKIESYDSQNTALGTGTTSDFLEFQTAERIRLKMDGTDIIEYETGTFAAAEKMLITIERIAGNTGTVRLYKNGSGVSVSSFPTGSDGNNTGAITFDRIGSRNSDRFFDGIIYELIVYGDDLSDLSSADISKVNDYLKNKHNL
jgi:hypothetical protein